MSQNCVLLRVGIDAGAGGIQGPLFDDGTFEFVCIPDGWGIGIHTYSTMIGRNGRPHLDYFPASRQRQMAEQTIHLDPEFETFTYGDPTTPKRSLRNLKPGDFLVFYCGLQKWDSDCGWDRTCRPALYLAGFFEVALAGMACDFDRKTLKAEFGNNFHVRYRSVFEQQKRRPGVGEGRSRQSPVPQGVLHQRGGARPGGQAAEGSFPQDAEGIRRLRRSYFNPEESTSLG